MNFHRSSELGVQHTTGSFRTQVEMIGDSLDFDLNAVYVDLNSQMDRFTNLGSAWVLTNISKCTIHIARFRPFVGSSYIKTPDVLIRKHARIMFITRMITNVFVGRFYLLFTQVLHMLNMYYSIDNMLTQSTGLK
jgi:hypothetical protein